MEHLRDEPAEERAPQPRAQALLPGAAAPPGVGHLLQLQASAGNAAVARMLARQRVPPPAGAPDPVKELVDRLLDWTKYEEIMRAALAAGGRWDDVQHEWAARKQSIPLLLHVRQKLSEGDAMRIYAYLRFGQLRLADKVAIAGAGPGADDETAHRILPAVHAALAGTTADFTASYANEGDTAFGAVAKQDGTLIDGAPNQIAGYLGAQMSGSALAKARVLLSRGSARPIDEVWIALEATVVRSGEVMAALDKVAAAQPGDLTIQTQFRQTYHGQELLHRLEDKLGGREADDYRKAKLIISGTYTLRERIKFACEGAGTSLKEIWKALEAASESERKELYANDWAQWGEIRKMVEAEWSVWDKDLKRIEAWLRGGEAMNDRLAQFGLDVKDTQGVIVAAFRDRRVGDAFRAEYRDPQSAFRKGFTDEDRNGAARLWGDEFTSKEWRTRFRLAIDLASEEGVLGILAEDVKTDDERSQIAKDPSWLPRLKKMDAWPRIEPLIMPKDDLKARSDWMGEKGKEAGSASSSATAAAFADEKRELDAALAKTKDPHNLTPEERKTIGPQAAATEESLQALMRVRDELDAVAIQVIATVAGIAATVATGGTAGPATAGLLARVALAQACASASAVWVVKGERTSGGEAAHAFAVGAATGVANVLAASAALKMIPATPAADAAKGIAAGRFSDVGAATLRGAFEGAASGGAAAAVDAGTRMQTWNQGFVEGLSDILAATGKGGVQGAAIGGAIHPLRAALFGPAAAKPAEGGGGTGGGGPTGPPPVPPKLEPVHIQRARVMLQAGEGIDFKRWQLEILPAFAEHEPIGRQALDAARRQLVEEAVARAQEQLTREGVTVRITGEPGFGTALDVEFIPAAGRPTAETAPATHRAILKVREQLGENFDRRAGVRLRGQGEGPGVEDWSDLAQALNTTPARAVDNWNLPGDWKRVKPDAYELVFGARSLPDINRPGRIRMTLGHIVEKTSRPMHSMENLMPQLNAVNVKLSGIFARKPFTLQVDAHSNLAPTNINGKPIGAGSLRDAFGSGTFTVDEQRALGYYLLDHVLAEHPTFEPELAHLVGEIPDLMARLRVEE